MNSIKNAIRNWLGLNQELQNIAATFANLADGVETGHENNFKLFSALPFSAGIISLTAKDAAKLTNPGYIEQNTLGALLTGIVMNARLGQSSFQVEGELNANVAKELVKRGFRIEDMQGSGENTGVFILWT